MVEAAGVEPASENNPHRPLHTYPEFWDSPGQDPFRPGSRQASLRKGSPFPPQADGFGYPASRRPFRTRRKSPEGR